jgi:hypothetical protein
MFGAFRQSVEARRVRHRVRLGVLPLLSLCVVLTGCPLPERTIFYGVEGSVFKAQDVAEYRIDVSDIIIAWHPESAVDALAHHAAYKTEVMWKASAVRPVQLAGLKFELLKTPPGFKLDVDKTGKLPKSGSFSLEIYTVTRGERSIIGFDEISPETIARIESR